LHRRHGRTPPLTPGPDPASLAAAKPGKIERETNRKGAIEIDAEFNFEEWAQLARVDPATFESRRRTVVQDFLARSSERQRRLGVMLQHEIDSVIARAPNPHAAFMSLAKMVGVQAGFLAAELESLCDDFRHLVAAGHGSGATGQAPSP
jgi:hypothetical protein